MCLLNAYSCCRASNGVSGQAMSPTLLQRGVQSTRKSLQSEAITNGKPRCWGVVGRRSGGFPKQAWVIFMQSCVRACPLIGSRGLASHPSTGGHKILPSWVVIWAWAGGGRVAEQHGGRIHHLHLAPLSAVFAEKARPGQSLPGAISQT